MALLIHLWDDFTDECYKRGIRPEYNMFSLWLDAVSPAAKRKLLNGEIQIDPISKADSPNNHTHGGRAR